ncbi:MAG TPA: hypothetical protein VM238_10550 [Phycisphaerae bacterium]|nr:hypothetical protein [Phycisphaerae bacterium]
MADKTIRFRAEATGRTLYAVLCVQDPDSADCGKYVDAATGTPEAMATANWGNYDIPLTESPAGGYEYAAALPANVAAGFYRAMIFEQAGGAPAVADQILADGSWHYDGACLRETTKAIEQMLAVIAGKAVHTAATGVTQFRYRDGTTLAATVTTTGSGNRSASVMT